MTLDSLDVKQMKLLLALLEERNLTRVATKLCVSQQAVSEQLKKLRQAFNDKLFVRAKNGVIPTPFADELGTVLKEVVNRLEGVSETQQFKPENIDKTYVIAATEYAQLVILSDFARLLRSRSPSVRLVIKPLDEDTIENALTQGQVDLALCEDQQTPANLPKRKLLSDAYVCVASKPTAAASPRRQPAHLILTRTHSRLDRLVSQWETALAWIAAPHFLYPPTR